MMSLTFAAVGEGAVIRKVGGGAVSKLQGAVAILVLPQPLNAVLSAAADGLAANQRRSQDATLHMEIYPDMAPTW
jgi:hypothetical protein